jgi:hypothetical protein
MPKLPRFSTGGVVYHVLNCGVGRSVLLADEPDYLAMPG